MTKKIFRSVLFAVTAVLILSFTVVTCVLYNHIDNATKQQLSDELSLAVSGTDIGGDAYLSTLKSRNYRLTLIDKDGEVLFDTEAEAKTMENHLGREEIKEALENGIGESSRYSSTLMQKMHYKAVKLSDGTVLRISVGQDSVWALLLNMLTPMVFILLAAIILSSILARRMAKAIVAPLDSLDLEAPEANDTYEELSPVLTKIANQRKQIEKQLQSLRQKNDEFEKITAYMNEGLILLSKNGTVLSINNAAKKLFSVKEEPTGKNILSIDRSDKLNNAVHSALTGKNAELNIEKSGGEYELLVSGIESDGQIIGAVILSFDITEKVTGERNRKEFTANVSHELKTPLQSIIGSAELLENGLVKEEDTPRFIGHIRNEAQRLVTLIDDIIRLSRLDENVCTTKKAVDLYGIAAQAANELYGQAQKKNITVTLSGEECKIPGEEGYLFETVYNLCDNAIRYGKEGGKVDITVKKEKGNAVLIVSDNGIGIPEEHQSRIFERFYRVDKSHSKETGGTGLGLSIVKHAVTYHNGKIELRSKDGEGTKITVTFPTV